MRVGILGGTGPLGRGLAGRLASAGVAVTIGSRDAARATAIAAELVDRFGAAAGIEAAGSEATPHAALDIEGADNQTAAGCDVVVVATPWDAAVPTVAKLAEALRSKVVVSAANALAKQGRETVALMSARGSVAATVQAALPESLVSAACHHLPADRLLEPGVSLDADVLVCSDHARATEVTIDMLGRVPGLRPLDAGSLAVAAPIEAFTAVLVNLNIRYKAHTTLRVSGLESVSGLEVERR